MPCFAKTVVSCQQSVAENQPSISLQQARLLVSEALHQYDFQVIQSSKIKHQEDFDKTHPDRSDGENALNMKIGYFSGRKVVLKKASDTEMQLARIFFQLGISPRFHGTVGFWEYYVVDFIPDAVLIKSLTFDRRMKDFIQRGFRLQEQSKEKIRSMLSSLGKIGIEPNDPNFLVTMTGDVYLIDPGHFKFTNTARAIDSTKLLQAQIENTFQKIELLQKHPNLKH